MSQPCGTFTEGAFFYGGGCTICGWTKEQCQAAAEPKTARDRPHSARGTARSGGSTARSTSSTARGSTARSRTAARSAAPEAPRTKAGPRSARIEDTGVPRERRRERERSKKSSTAQAKARKEAAAAGELDVAHFDATMRAVTGAAPGKATKAKAPRERKYDGTTALRSHRPHGKKAADDEAEKVVMANKERCAANLTLAGHVARDAGNLDRAEKCYTQAALVFGTLVAEEQDTHKGKRGKDRERTDRSDKDDAYTWQDTADDRKIAEQQWMGAASYEATDGPFIKVTSNADLLKHCKMSEKNKKRLRDTFGKTGPSMTDKKLQEFLASLGCHGNRQGYFAAFDRKGGRSWIGVDDFMFGCAALDARTPNTGPWRAERAGCIFRYFTKGAQKMPHKTLTMVLDAIQKTVPDHTLEYERPITQAKRINPGGNALDVNDFCSLVLSDTISGTSRLFRFCILDRLQ